MTDAPKAINARSFDSIRGSRNRLLHHPQMRSSPMQKKE
ncbi:hypothetical protein SynWH8103_01629 [Synechococcus sp. WH 8103]|nr:hypothetical protein SynBOUM118_01562 [Synechococcus sp. BOUM118]CRY92356.1 hypothetical protein SynWH8103_01629 [Synechococcus sp. WH 8103]